MLTWPTKASGSPAACHSPPALGHVSGKGDMFPHNLSTELLRTGAAALAASEGGSERRVHY